MTEITDKNITDLLNKIDLVQNEVPSIPKTGVNPFHKSKYATLDTILDILKPILHKYGLVVTQLPTSDDTNRMGLTTTVWDVATGTWIGDTIFVDIPDEGQHIQTVGKQLTYLRRYALSSVFCLSTEDDTDGNPIVKQERKPKQKKNLRDKLAARAAEYDKAGEEVTDKQRGMLAGMLEMCFTDEPEKNRKIFMDMVWDKTSVKDLTSGEVKAGLDFLRIDEGMPGQEAIGTVMRIAREGLE